MILNIETQYVIFSIPKETYKNSINGKVLSQENLSLFEQSLTMWCKKLIVIGEEHRRVFSSNLSIFLL